MEFIGREVEVLAAADPTHRAVRGRIVDETKQLLVIEVSGREKRIPKAGSLFRIAFEREAVVIPGEEIRYRPEDRVKRVR